MVAYVVVFRERSIDRSYIADYLSRATAISDEHGLVILAQNGRQDVREGDPVEGVTILKFPSYEAAQRWYDDPRYQEALAIRRKAGEYHCVIVEGV